MLAALYNKERVKDARSGYWRSVSDESTVFSFDVLIVCFGLFFFPPRVFMCALCAQAVAIKRSSL